MGAIVRAVDSDIRREVAIKFLLNTADDRLRIRFVVAEILCGHADPKALGTGGEFSLLRLLNIFNAVCNGLGYAHSRNVIHRDLKPANIMVGDSLTLAAATGRRALVGRVRYLSAAKRERSPESDHSSSSCRTFSCQTVRRSSTTAIRLIRLQLSEA